MRLFNGNYQEQRRKTMAKGIKYGGRKAVDNEPRDKNIRVRESTKLIK